MEPRIRYVRSADGTRIAAATLGEGQPLVIINNYYVTIEVLWEIPEVVENAERLSQKRTVVLYDARGAGLSAQRIAASRWTPVSATWRPWLTASIRRPFFRHTLAGDRSS